MKLKTFTILVLLILSIDKGLCEIHLIPPVELRYFANTQKIGQDPFNPTFNITFFGGILLANFSEIKIVYDQSENTIKSYINLLVFSGYYNYTLYPALDDWDTNNENKEWVFLGNQVVYLERFFWFNDISSNDEWRDRAINRNNTIYLSWTITSHEPNYDDLEYIEIWENNDGSIIEWKVGMRTHTLLNVIIFGPNSNITNNFGNDDIYLKISKISGEAEIKHDFETSVIIDYETTSYLNLGIKIIAFIFVFLLSWKITKLFSAKKKMKISSIEEEYQILIDNVNKK